ncbi:MAG: hypothetical protein HYU57_07510 [Micavibrio aeruginosavorus]|nr:hypothetical protein [Micavibrio aeruginosavorus]
MGFVRRHKIASALALILLAAGAGAAVLPWKPLLERQLTALLEQKGFENVHLSIAGIGWKQIALQDVSLGKTVPFTLKDAGCRRALDGRWAGRGDENRREGCAPASSGH